MSRLAHFEPAAMAMATLEEEDFLDLRWCRKCCKKGYLRKGACVNSACAGFLVLSRNACVALGGLRAFVISSSGRPQPMYCCTLTSFCGKKLTAEVKRYMRNPEWRRMQRGKWWEDKQWGVEEWTAAWQ